MPLDQQRIEKIKASAQRVIANRGWIEEVDVLRSELVELCDLALAGGTLETLRQAIADLAATAGVTLPPAPVQPPQEPLEPIAFKGGRITVARVQQAVCRYYDLTQAELLSKSLCIGIARPRQIGMWLANRLTTCSMPEIGRRFGGRNHATVYHAVGRIDALTKVEPGLDSDVEALISMLQTEPKEERG